MGSSGAAAIILSCGARQGLALSRSATDTLYFPASDRSVSPSASVTEAGRGQAIFSAGMHTIYAALPFLFTAIPLGILTDTLLEAARGKEPPRKGERQRTELFAVLGCVGQGRDSFLNK